MLFDREFPKDGNGEPLFPCLEQFTAPVKEAERVIVGRDKEKARLMAAMQRPELCNVILLAEAGSGKALANDTKIPVYDKRGFVNIGDIKIGDVVFDEKGRPTTVIGVYPQGEKEAYLVKFADGSEVICNDEHLWQVKSFYQYYSGQESETMSLAKMLRKGISVSGRPKWYVPKSAAVARKEKKQKVPAYLVGILLGSRWTINEGPLALDIPAIKNDVLQYVSDWVGALAFNLNCTGGCKFAQKDENEIPYWIETNVITDKLPQYSRVIGCKPEERQIPDGYMLGSIEQRKELLRGIMDVTGYVESKKSGGIGVRVPGKELATDIKRLVKSLGIKAEICDFYSGGYSVKFSLPPDEKLDLFKYSRLTQKVRRYENETVKSTKRYDGLAIVSVTKLNKTVPMTCIRVDSENHLFLCTEDYIVTHNTALVQGTMLDDDDRYYLEVDIPKIVSAADDPGKVANEIKNLFEEVQIYCRDYNAQIVLFIDEFHQIVQQSPPAVEALKPLLADSGTRGIRVIAATTYIEFRKWISPNQPLVERLQRINLEPPDKKMVVTILRGMARRYGVDHHFTDDRIFEDIYDLTNRYIPANAQPRKSILLLDAMVGWHRYDKRKFNKKLLADVIYEAENVNIAFRVDATKIKETIDEHVFAQQYATSAIQDRLQLCVADLNDKSKPMSSFLFCGSTGVGKGITDDEIIPVWTPDGSVLKKKNGELVVGDYVYNRKGEPVMVTGVYHRGLKDVYRVTLSDGRSIIVDGSHLWTWRYARGHKNETYVTSSTEELIKRGLYVNLKDGGVTPKVYIPMNEAVQYPEREFDIHPYVVGALIGNGCLTIKDELTISSGNSFVPKKIAKLIGVEDTKQHHANYNWVFITERVKGPRGGLHNRILTRDVCLKDVPELIDKKSFEKFIPDVYKYGSVEQRWQLIQGLFDTDGTIGQFDGERYNVSYSTTSLRLAEDIKEVLFSLGVASSIINCGNRNRGENYHDEYHLHVSVSNQIKPQFFTLPKKLNIAETAKSKDKIRRKRYDEVAIVSIEPLSEKMPTTCIMVEDDEHLYQAGEFIVTHNTEVSKQLAQILFNDSRRLIRFDMSEYANNDSLDLFRKELTARVWERPYSIILLDEVEKSCAPVTRLLLQVLDDGRLTDENNREVSFINSYIILTTNAGNEVFAHAAQYNASDTGDGSTVKELQKLIRNSIQQTAGDNKFPPELLGRIDCIVPFQPLSRETQAKILKSKIDKLTKEISEKHNIILQFAEIDRLYRFIIDDNLDTEASSGGARRVISKYEEEVVTKIAAAINRADSSVQVLTVRVAGELATDDKHKRTSSAYIVVDVGKSRSNTRWL